LVIESSDGIFSHSMKILKYFGQALGKFVSLSFYKCRVTTTFGLHLWMWPLNFAVWPPYKTKTWQSACNNNL